VQGIVKKFYLLDPLAHAAVLYNQRSRSLYFVNKDMSNKVIKIFADLYKLLNMFTNFEFLLI